MIAACCQNPANRETVTATADRWHERCRECGRNHYGMQVDPIRVGLTGADIGKTPGVMLNGGYRVRYA